MKESYKENLASYFALEPYAGDGNIAGVASASGESARATTSVGQVLPFVANATINPNAKIPPAAPT